MKIIFVRHEDYWVFPLSFFSVLFTAMFLYAEVLWIRCLCGLLGFGGLYFSMYVIRKNYSRRLAARYMLICLASVILLTVGLYYLTN